MKYFIFFFIICQVTFAKYQVGMGKADITGPFAKTNTMGYAAPVPKSDGIHLRLWARAFVILDENQNRIVHVTADTCFISQAVTLEVEKQLQKKFGNIYSVRNLMLTANHTHAATGGLSHYRFTNLPAGGGYYKKNFEAVTSGIVRAISRAHQNLSPGEIKISKGDLIGASVNRSLEAYLQNPEEERKRYKHNIDPTMTVYRFEKNGKPVGMLNFFAVHATSMDKTNSLISSDNKGYASHLFEKKMKNKNPNFIAAFANANAGDASPGIAKDTDGDGDWECKENENFACTSDIAQRHLKKAMELFDKANFQLKGPIAFRHQFNNMGKIQIQEKYSGLKPAATTCPSAIGFAMVAGTAEDGPGMGKEGNNCLKPLNQKTRLACANFIFSCHWPKPVILSTAIGKPPLSPQIVPVQLFQIGQSVILGAPGEFTTMSGRRVRELVAKRLAGFNISFVTFSGYANAYTHYVTTNAEYKAQHYEGGSTHYGPWTLAAYMQLYSQLADDLVSGTETIDTDTVRRDMALYAKEAKIYSKPDRKKKKFKYGQITSKIKKNYKVGDLISFSYVSSNPNNNIYREKGFFEIQKFSSNKWKTIYHDWDWETKLSWKAGPFGRSYSTISWQTSSQDKPGKYRVLLRGLAIEKKQTIPYENQTATFSLE